MTQYSRAAKVRMTHDARSIQDQLRLTKSSADEVLFNSFELGKRMLTARMNPDVPAHLGQAAIIRLTAAQRSMVESATNLFRVHDELSDLAVETGVMDKPGTTPPSGFSVTTENASEEA